MANFHITIYEITLIFEIWSTGEKSLKDLSVTVKECIKLQGYS
jgi:hypothetical protein